MTFERAEQFRRHLPVGHLPGTSKGERFGVFMMTIPGSQQLRMIANDAEETGWEHVSVTKVMMKKGKAYLVTPTWEDMCVIKDLFWNKDECVVQFHPPQEEYVNNHPHCLHLWRRVGAEFETPPKIYV